MKISINKFKVEKGKLLMPLGAFIELRSDVFIVKVISYLEVTNVSEFNSFNLPKILDAGNVAQIR